MHEMYNGWNKIGVVEYNIGSCKKYLTERLKSGSIIYSDRVAETCEACDRGRPSGVSSFYITGRTQNAKDIPKL